MKVYVIEQQGWGNSFSFVKVFKTYEAARDWCRKQFEIQHNTEYKPEMKFIEEATDSGYTRFMDISMFMSYYRGHWEEVTE